MSWDILIYKSNLICLIKMEKLLSTKIDAEDLIKVFRDFNYDGFLIYLKAVWRVYLIHI